MIMTHKKSGLFSYLLLLTSVFCLFEISFFLQRSWFYLGNYRLVASHLKIPAVVIPGIIYFIMGQVIIHLGFTAVIWIITRLAGIKLRLPWHKIQNMGFMLWGIGIVTILFANQYFFPNSQFADLISGILPKKLAVFILVLSTIVFFTAVTLAIAGFIEILLSIEKDFKIHLLPAARSFAAIKIRRSKFVGILASISVIVLISVLLSYASKNSVVTDGATTEKPNVILIGVDALRPDFLSYFGHSVATPFFDDFLNQSVVFSNAITPIARTFPSWMTIFSGQYPKQNQMRFDLADSSKIDFANLLPTILQQHGYHTVFAMDETRFSNITQQFGFNQVITPPTGFNDFFLGTLNDFPLSNLVVNTPLGKRLFPFSYANRAAYVTYDPNSFINFVDSALEKSRSKPLFLAVHFCLTHYPYLWSNAIPHSTRIINHYQAAVSRVDTQVKDFLAMLQRNGILQRSIVILLSDHGEGLELPGDRITGRRLFVLGDTKNTHIQIPHFYPPSLENEKFNQSAGHGTDVLGLTQYHTVLAFRLYGLGVYYARLVSGVVSVMDIKASLLQLLRIKTKADSGVSLASFIKNKKLIFSSAKRKDFLMESDFSPEAVRTTHPEARKLLFEGIDFFQLNPKTAWVTVKPSMGNMIISSKQYANIHGEWILALYPQVNGFRMPILVNLKTGQWTNDLRTHFAQHSPAQRMLHTLKEFYGDEIGKLELT